MDLGAPALEAYQFNRAPFMGFPFCFVFDYLCLLFNIHGYIPFSEGKMRNTFKKNGGGRFELDNVSRFVEHF
jgi:hypothetical protein